MFGVTRSATWLATRKASHDSDDYTENEHTFPFVRNLHTYQNSISAFHSTMILESPDRSQGLNSPEQAQIAAKGSLLLNAHPSGTTNDFKPSNDTHALLSKRWSLLTFSPGTLLEFV